MCSKPWLVSTGGLLAGSLVLAALSLALNGPASADPAGTKPTNGWSAPPEASQVRNPLIADPASAGKGKAVFEARCKLCHGPLGKGDGPGGMFLTPKPADLTSAAVRSQTDGALFWKISEGRPPAMVAHKTILSESDRWSVVNFIRSLRSQGR